MNRLIRIAGVIVVLVLIFGSIYAETQRQLRSDANDPQIQLAEDAAARLDDGAKPLSVLPTGVNMEKSLSPFVIVYDQKGTVVAGSGYLNDKVPAAPLGVLTAAKGQDYHTVTWQPQDGVRIAAVTVAAKDYYVLAGRSLREVEKREDVAFNLALLGGALSAVTVGAVYYLAQKRSAR